MRRVARVGLLCGASMILVTLLQSWIGVLTIYSEDYDGPVLELHEAILHNRLPPGKSWTEFGANGSNTRVLVIYLVEGIHRLTGLQVRATYRFVDSTALFLVFVLFFYYLRYWLDEAYCAIGLLYLTSVLPLTYFFHYYAPWDRVGLLAWLVLLFAIRARRTGLVAVLLAVAMLIKYDVVVVPGLVALATFERRRLGRWAATVGGLFLLTFGIFYGLTRAFPGGVSRSSLQSGYPYVVNLNLGDIVDFGLSYPPILVFLLPVLLAIPNIMRTERFARATTLFGFSLFIPFMFFHVFREVRAEVPVLLLILPAALLNLRLLLEPN